MFLTAANLAKSKAKIILVRMLSEAGTGVAFNMKRGRLEEKLVKLRYDPVGKLEGLDKEEYFHLVPEEVMMAPGEPLWGEHSTDQAPPQKRPILIL